MNDYDAFARVYDRHWADEGVRRLPRVREALLARLPAGARLLDLCCGSGRVAERLVGDGYRVTGLDGSGELLAIARARVAGADFVHADARAFELAGFDGALSLSDSLNHVLAIADLERVFKNVFAALVPGGWFFFDLNLAYKYASTWAGTLAFVDDDQVCVARASADVAARLARFDATIFERRSSEAAGADWRRADVGLRQTWYAEADVAAALAAAGFSDTAIDHSQPDAPERSDKAFFLARRPV
jgi:SAM-dependent methyltransferase